MANVQEILFYLVIFSSIILIIRTYYSYRAPEVIVKKHTKTALCPICKFPLDVRTRKDGTCPKCKNLIKVTKTEMPLVVAKKGAKTAPCPICNFPLDVSDQDEGTCPKCKNKIKVTRTTAPESKKTEIKPEKDVQKPKGKEVEPTQRKKATPLEGCPGCGASLTKLNHYQLKAGDSTECEYCGKMILP